MENIFVEFLPPWIETGLQPAFYDKESGTVLQQTARMYARVNMLIRMFNKLSKNTKEEVERFETSVNETVENYIEQFNQLHDYVHDYFDNLDVQEEINNKLDDMVEAGTLQEIITTYIQSNVAWTFDNVAEMKLATNLTDDSFAQTIGFYNANDKGGALYKIRAKTNDDTVDEMTLIDLYDNTLVAELIKTEVMNVKQFGAKGDGINDDTLAIQTALNFNTNILVPSGTYMVNAITHININSGNRLLLSNDATIKAITTSQDNYAVILCNDVDDVEISGGTIEGDRLTHTGETGEWGMCISITNGSSNINIHDIKLVNAWGDGLYLNGGNNVRTQNVTVDSARRNGYSIVSAVNFRSLNDIIKNTNGTAPQAGVDIEPNYDTDKLQNIKFINMITENNLSSGIMMMIGHDNDCSIEITNHSDDGSLNGISVAKSTGTTGYINILESKYRDNVENGILLRGCYNSECLVNIIKPTIINCNTSEKTSPKYGATISCYTESADSDYPLGNITITEAYGTNAVLNQTLFSFINDHTSENSKIMNVKIFNPLSIKNNNPLYGSATNDIDIVIIDEYESLGITFGGTLSVSANSFFSVLKFNGTTARTTTLSASTKVGREFTLKNLGTVAHSLKIPDDQYCLQLGNGTGLTLTLPKTGDSIKLKKFDATHWIVVDKNCNPTIS